MAHAGNPGPAGVSLPPRSNVAPGNLADQQLLLATAATTMMMIQSPRRPTQNRRRTTTRGTHDPRLTPDQCAAL